MKKITLILVAAALTLGIGCKTTTNNYNVAPDPGPGTDPGTNPGVGQTTDVTPPDFTIDSMDWTYYPNPGDTIEMVECLQDNIAYDGGIIKSMSLVNPDGTLGDKLPDNVNGTSFSYKQTKTGFFIIYSAEKGRDPGAPGRQTFSVTITLPAQKSNGYKSITLTILVKVQRTKSGTVVSFPERAVRHTSAPTNPRAK